MKNTHLPDHSGGPAAATHEHDGPNSAQQDAITSTEGAIRIIAGAGTGKTRTLTDRYCYLVSMLGVAPRNIMCVTFTNRAANEMKRRVRRTLGDLDLGMICTFHAFCVQLLKEDIHLLNFPRNFIILDMEDLKQMLLKIFSDMGLTLRDTTIKRTLDEVLEARKLQATGYIDDIYQLNNEQLKARFVTARDRDEEIFLRYIYEQKKCFGCDFNDLINFATWILEKFPDVRHKWQDRMQYVMVDEFQDVSKRQYQLARLLAGKHGNLFIVGDPDQTIYSWRGAHLRLFLDFDKVYPAAKTIALTMNYRSSPQILAASNHLIEQNQVRVEKTLQAQQTEGPKPSYYHAKSERLEAEWIAERVAELQAKGINSNDIAVLYRAHFLTRALEECFISRGLPYTIFSGVAFYGRREIKDVICYLRMVTGADDLALLRTINLPSRRIGKKRLAALAVLAEERALSLYQALKENLDQPMFKGTDARQYVAAIEQVRQQRAVLTLGNQLQMLLDLSGYEGLLRLSGDQERLDNLAELKRSVQQAGDEDEEATLEEFLERVALFTSLDQESEHATLKLMTIHSAKGMEFRYVFICGMNEGVFPGRRISSIEEMEEERRLAYVAMTRAREGLYLSDAQGVANDGLFKYPSRFIFDAGAQHIDFLVPLEPAMHPEGRSNDATNGFISAVQDPMDRFRPGDRVMHPVFGSGTVNASHPDEFAYAVKFDGLPTERSMQFNAPLQKIT
ncbi:ATP-dependent helicase [Biostraticola tofi]|uniref:DNA 3'-5' helicase n=1 Tax=Biostraticola tofi TaxID=466109 RepID=A0A4R3YU12_9GAMM|nr:UvrD-helicase domain-containing protein [Biostraticola tofi]TCV95218.1 DNA helicase-2/ATP-dependent DNA helicase PcrA [Biostraticola tofi]